MQGDLAGSRQVYCQENPYRFKGVLALQGFYTLALFWAILSDNYTTAMPNLESLMLKISVKRDSGWRNELLTSMLTWWSREQGGFTLCWVSFTLDQTMSYYFIGILNLVL